MSQVGCETEAGPATRLVLYRPLSNILMMSHKHRHPYLWTGPVFLACPRACAQRTQVLLGRTWVPGSSVRVAGQSGLCRWWMKGGRVGVLLPPRVSGLCASWRAAGGQGPLCIQSVPFLPAGVQMHSAVAVAR